MNLLTQKFAEGEWIIYPKHGLGKTLGFEKQTFSETEVEFEIRLMASPIKLDIDNTTIFRAFVIFFEFSHIPTPPRRRFYSFTPSDFN